jgi:MFS family permease
MQFGAVVSMFGCTLQTVAVNVGMLCAGRVIAGLAIGIICFAIPMYQSEIAPPEHRFAFFDADERALLISFTEEALLVCTLNLSDLVMLLLTGSALVSTSLRVPSRLVLRVPS